MSKGSIPRPCSKSRYDTGFIRAFGKRCGVCNGRGFHYNEVKGKMVKTLCIICMGTGKEKGGKYTAEQRRALEDVR